MSEIRVGDMVQVKHPTSPTAYLAFSTYDQNISRYAGRVGKVVAFIDADSPNIGSLVGSRVVKVTVVSFSDDVQAAFSDYSLEKLENISPSHDESEAS